MNEIIDYQAIRAQSIHRLNELVYSQIKDKWQPFGGISSVAATLADDSLEPTEMVIFSQAMVKYA